MKDDDVDTSSIYAPHMKIIKVKDRAPANDFQVVSSKRRRKKTNKSRITMSLGEYQKSVLHSVRTDLQFTSFISLLVDIKRKHHITHVKAKELLVAVTGVTRYVQTKDLHKIYPVVERELIEEQEAIEENIQEENEKE